MRFVLALVLAILVFSQVGIHGIAQSTPQASPASTTVATPGIEAAAAWLVEQQDSSGGFVGFSGEPDPGLSIDAVLALKAVPADHSASLEAAGKYLLENGEVFADLGPGQAAKLTLALVALGLDPDPFGSIELIISYLDEAVDLEAGQIAYCGFGPFDHALCILAIVATGTELPAGFTDALVESQIDNGGWAFDGSIEASMADSNTTAIAVQALIAAGMTATNDSIIRALGYLESVIDPVQGGFAYDANTGLIADANSTAAVIQALIAAGEDPSSDEWGTATAALAGFQNESGAFRYQHEFPDDNLYATVQAIPALAGVALPIVAGT
jgi:hypothetical protein